MQREHEQPSRRKNRVQSKPYGSRYESPYVLASQKRALERISKSRQGKTPDRGGRARLTREPWNADVKVAGLFENRENEVSILWHKGGS